MTGISKTNILRLDTHTNGMHTILFTIECHVQMNRHIVYCFAMGIYISVLLSTVECRSFQRAAGGCYDPKTKQMRKDGSRWEIGDCGAYCWCRNGNLGCNGKLP